MLPTPSTKIAINLVLEFPCVVGTDCHYLYFIDGILRIKCCSRSNKIQVFRAIVTNLKHLFDISTEDKYLLSEIYILK